MRTDIVYMTWNRLEFTKYTFACLLQNTDWSLVDTLVVYDDGSEDGTREWIEQALRLVPVETILRAEVLRSPPGLMNRYLIEAESDRFAKIDSDIVVPPRWLNDLSTVMDEHPELELLGMEGGRMGVPRDEPEAYGYTLASHIGGVGLIDTKRVQAEGRIPERGRFGWTEHQWSRGFVRGWITPDLLTCQLDMVPCEPWLSLTARYIESGWARQWALMDERYPYWWNLPWWPDPERVFADEWTLDEVAA